VPGNTCSQIEARLTDAYEPPSAFCAARKCDGRWSLLWKNITAPDAEVPYFADQLRLVYDQAAGDYGNAPGVETRAVSFGSTRGLSNATPTDASYGKILRTQHAEERMRTWPDFSGRNQNLTNQQATHLSVYFP
jgi:lysophospholipase-3